MRKYIDILNETHDTEAQEIWASLSPMQKYALNERLPYAVGWEARKRQGVEFISHNLDEFRTKVEPQPQPDLEDGGIHRLY